MIIERRCNRKSRNGGSRRRKRSLRWNEVEGVKEEAGSRDKVKHIEFRHVGRCELVISCLWMTEWWSVTVWLRVGCESGFHARHLWSTLPHFSRSSSSSSDKSCFHMQSTHAPDRASAVTYAQTPMVRLDVDLSWICIWLQRVVQQIHVNKSDRWSLISSDVELYIAMLR